MLKKLVASIGKIEYIESPLNINVLQILSDAGYFLHFTKLIWFML